jgi:dethiobiotin synthetase
VDVSALFVAATQTEVGKTFTCAGILRASRRAGIDATYFKPLLSGGAPGDGASDPELVARAAGLPHSPRELVQHWFAEPASPHFAARLEGRRIDPSALVREARRRIAAAGHLLIEGCGGLAVPLTDEGYLLSDLAAELGIPVLLVAATRLGAIHEALVTLEHARSKGLAVAGIAWNGFEGSAREEDTIEMVERLAGVRRLLLVPRVKGQEELDRAFAGFAPHAFWRAVGPERSA